MSSLPHVLDLAALPLALAAAAQLVESVMFMVAASVSLWSRNPERRAEARRLMHRLRRPGGLD